MAQQTSHLVRCKFVTTNSGTGNISENTSLSNFDGYYTYKEALDNALSDNTSNHYWVNDQINFYYLIEQGSDWEIGVAKGARIYSSMQGEDVYYFRRNNSSYSAYVRESTNNNQPLDLPGGTSNPATVTIISTLYDNLESPILSGFEGFGNATSISIDYSRSNAFKAKLSSSNLTFNNFTNTSFGNTNYDEAEADINFILIVEVNSSSTGTITWPTSVQWPNGQAPPAPKIGSTAIYHFFKYDGYSNVMYWIGYPLVLEP